jgi:Sulfotransferase domain
MNVIGAGLPRTGTLSLKVALEMLGLGPACHMLDVIADPDRAALWEQARGGKAKWAKIFDGYDSAVGPPTSGFWEELIRAYPGAMVLLSVRDPESWGRSMSETAWGAREGEDADRAADGTASGARDGGSLRRTREGGSTARLIEAMERHNEAVRRGVPRERLLVWSVGDGWEPLCESFGIPVPDAPFPHLNEGPELFNRVAGAPLAPLLEWPALRESPAPVR